MQLKNVFLRRWIEGLALNEVTFCLEEGSGYRLKLKAANSTKISEETENSLASAPQ